MFNKFLPETTATPSKKFLYQKLNGGLYIFEDVDQLNKKCKKCNEFWPATSEFFRRHKTSPDGLFTQCKACESERREAQCN
jgi:hypothetical protein